MKTRLDTLRHILSSGAPGTQDELKEKLGAQGYDVTQSTISRDLRRLGAIKAIDEDGRTVYRFSVDGPLPSARASLSDLILDIQSNGSIIVVHTTPGSPSFIARHLDHYKPGGILGTIAGDDTIFVAPPTTHPKKIEEVISEIRQSLAGVSGE